MERLGFTNRPAERISSGAQESNEMSNVMPASNISSPTQFLETKKGKYVYRRFGNGPGLPLLFLQHFTGTLDNWDPAVTDPLATGREVILFESAGLGRSSGRVPETVAGMRRAIRGPQGYSSTRARGERRSRRDDSRSQFLLAW